MLKFRCMARLQSPGTRKAWRDLLVPLGAPAHRVLAIGICHVFFPHRVGRYGSMCGRVVRYVCKDALKLQFPFSL